MENVNDFDCDYAGSPDSVLCWDCGHGSDEPHDFATCCETQTVNDYANMIAID